MARRHELIQVGTIAPAFELADPWGRRHSLANLRGVEQTTLTWATKGC